MATEEEVFQRETEGDDFGDSKSYAEGVLSSAIATTAQGIAGFANSVARSHGYVGADGAGHYSARHRPGMPDNGPLATALRYKMTPELARQMSTAPGVKIASYDPRLLMKNPGHPTAAEIENIQNINAVFHKAGKKVAAYLNVDWSKLDGDELRKAAYEAHKLEQSWGFDAQHRDDVSPLPESKQRIIAEAVYQASKDAIAERKDTWAKEHPGEPPEQPTMHWNGAPDIAVNILKDHKEYVDAINNGGEIIIEHGLGREKEIAALTELGVKNIVVVDFIQNNDANSQAVADQAYALAQKYPDIHVMMLPTDDASKATLKNTEGMSSTLGLGLPSWDGRWGAETGRDAALKLGLNPRFNYSHHDSYPDLVTLEAQGVKFPVAREYAGNFQYLLDQLQARGYQFSTAGGAGGYANRTTASGAPSQHAEGNAIDINPLDNPEGWGRNNLPSDVGILAARAGISWGGYMERSRGPDQMHFEYNASNGQPPMTLEQYQQKKVAAAEAYARQSNHPDAPNLEFASRTSASVLGVAPIASPANWGLGFGSIAQSGPIDRSRLTGEMSSDIIYRLAWMVKGETGGIGNDLSKELIQLESAGNRALIREQTLAWVLQNQAEAGNRGYYANATYREGARPTQEEMQIFQEKLLKPFLAGSDESTRRFGFPVSGNASGSVAYNGAMSGDYAGGYETITGETYALHTIDYNRLQRNPGLLYGTPKPAEQPKVASIAPAKTELPVVSSPPLAPTDQIAGAEDRRSGGQDPAALRSETAARAAAEEAKKAEEAKRADEARKKLAEADKDKDAKKDKKEAKASVPAPTAA